MSVLQITAQELKSKLAKPDAITLLDVRELDEYRTANLGGLHIPLSQLATRWNEVDQTREIVVMCHHGMRSLQAAQFLVDKGVSNVLNLRGGIDQWSLQIDPNIPRY